MAQYPVGPQVTQVWAGSGPVLLANQDLVNPVTVSTSMSVFMDSPAGDVIPPLGSIAYVGGQTLYAIAPAGTAGLLAIAGGTSWAPSPADVALQISTLGLAQDATVKETNAQLGMGVAPFISKLQSAQALQIGPGASPDTFLTFTDDGRIWGAHLSFAIAANSAHTGTDQAYARLVTGSGLTLTVVEVAASQGSGTDSGDSDLPLYGVPISQGDTLQLDVNNGAAITGLIFRASATVLYTVP